MKFPILKLLANAGMTVSMSEGRRCVVMGAVSVNDSPVTDLTAEVDVQPGDVVKVGRSFRILTADILDAK